MRIVIVGGVAGGATAAARARRLSETAEIVILERGPYVSFANCGLPYHIAGTIPERDHLLVQTPEGLSARYDIDVRVGSDVLALNLAAREVRVRELRTGREYALGYDALILSPGSEPIRPDLPGIDDPRIRTLRNMADMDALIELVRTATCRTALVVGAGYIGLEIAESMRHRGLDVVLVERLPHVMGNADPEMAAPLHAELRRHGVDLRLGTSVRAFHPYPDRLEAVLDDHARVDCGLAVIAVGVRPETSLAREAGLDLGPTGGIRVDERMQTSDPRVWAVGDAIEVQDFVTGLPSHIPLAGPANRQGRIAADNVLGRPSRYTATQGTAICRVFDLVFAMTGATEARLARAGRPSRSAYLHPGDHAAYYPGAHPVSLKVVFDPGDGRVLGAQAVGASGADKRIDVLSVAIRAGMTVFDLQDLELCYAPPFGSAKDPVNVAGFIAGGMLSGDAPTWEPGELAALRPDQDLLDVRTFEEHARGTIPGATCAPVDELRDRLEEISTGREQLVFCEVGLRGYVATRFLLQRGHRARNLSGGYRRYLMATDAVVGRAAAAGDGSADDGRAG